MTNSNTLLQLTASLEEKRGNVQALQKSQDKLKQEQTTAQTSLANAEELLQTLLTGLSTASANTSGGGYLGQLADAKQRASQAKSDEEQTRRRLASKEKELSAVDSKMKTVQRDADQGRKELEKAEKELEAMKTQLKQLGFDAEGLVQKDRDLAQAQQRVRQLTEVCPVHCILEPLSLHHFAAT